MSEKPFEITSIDEIPKLSFSKGSKYDPVIDQFLKMGVKNGKITMIDEKTGEPYKYDYLVSQLNNRIKKRIDLDQKHTLHIKDGTLKARQLNKNAYLTNLTVE